MGRIFDVGTAEVGYLGQRRLSGGLSLADGPTVGDQSPDPLRHVAHRLLPHLPLGKKRTSYRSTAKT